MNKDLSITKEKKRKERKRRKNNFRLNRRSIWGDFYIYTKNIFNPTAILHHFIYQTNNKSKKKKKQKKTCNWGLLFFMPVFNVVALKNKAFFSVKIEWVSFKVILKRSKFNRMLSFCELCNPRQKDWLLQVGMADPSLDSPVFVLA